jgi:hypothetical protein
MKTIDYDVMVDMIERSFENDDPSIIEDILNREIENDELLVKEHIETYIEDLILNAIHEKKANLYLFLTKNINCENLSQCIPIACVETHTVFSFKRGDIEVQSITELYKVKDGELIFDEDKFQEVASNCSGLEHVDDFWISEFKGGYPQKFYSKDDPDLQNMLKRYDIKMKFEKPIWG